jgi:dCMP deaminase
MSQIIIAYIPVLHQGYVQFLQKYPEAILYLLDRSLTDQWRPLQKDIRALSPQQIKISVEALELAKEVRIVDLSDLNQIGDSEIIMPDEEIMHELAAKFLSAKKIKFDSAFLRWDAKKSSTEQAVLADGEVTGDEFHRQFMVQAQELATKSADWWRQIGAIIVKDGQILFEGYNHHVPSDQQPYIDGDPRADFHQGDHIELSTAFHAEASLISQAAREGISLAGASMYVTTFPCPNCAKLIAYSGIKEIYFKEGYAMLDGETILKSQGIKIIRIS